MSTLISWLLGQGQRIRKRRKSVNYQRRRRRTNLIRRGQIRKKQMRNIVQKLFETCKQVFATGEAGCVPPAADIERLRLVLDSMKPEDVNLTPSMPYFNRAENEDAPPITYLHIYECNKFSIGIFCLPPSGVIPLHNHPGMTVFSKLLFGTKHIKSYDWVTEIPSSMDENGNILRDLAGQRPGTRLAKVHIDSDCTAPCKTSILYPAAGGNMHCFRALTACAVLDVLGPPYSDSEGRQCAYYHDFPCTIFSGGAELLPEDNKGYAWLEERERPENFIVVGAPYRGP